MERSSFLSDFISIETRFADDCNKGNAPRETSSYDYEVAS